MAYFSNFHNPADTATYRRQGKWRPEATRIEIALQNQLQPSGIPRFMTGDMNERDAYFCRVTKGAPVKARPAASTGATGSATPTSRGPSTGSSARCSWRSATTSRTAARWSTRPPTTR